jgi:hypothetical protein
VLPTFTYLFNKLAAFEKEVHASPEIFTDYYANCINAGFAKMKEYYTKMDESRVYSTAVALHPYYRLEWFEEQWKDTPDSRREIRRAKDAVKQHYHDFLDKLQEQDKEVQEQPPLVP